MPSNCRMTAMVFPAPTAKSVEIQVRANSAGQSGTLRLEAPAGWRVSPESRPFELAEVGQQSVAAFEVTPPDADARRHAARHRRLWAAAPFPLAPISSASRISPPKPCSRKPKPGFLAPTSRHSPRISATSRGAGDEVAESLKQIGAEVTLLTSEDLARGNLRRFDAIVTGVRAYNTREDLRANRTAPARLRSGRRNLGGAI